MKRLVALLWLLLPAAVHAQAPQCTAAAPSSIACQSVGLTPQLSDILLGQQGTGPLRPNQTVQWPMSALFAPTAPAVAALLAAPPAIGGTTAAPGNFSSLSVNGVPVSPPGGATTQVQFNCAGLFCGDSTFTFNASTKQVGVAGGTNGVGALAVGTAGASSLLLGGAASVTPLISAQGATNVNLGLEAKGTGAVAILNPGGVSAGLNGIVSVFASTSQVTDQLNIIPTTTAAQMLIRTQNSQGITFSNFPMQISRAPYAVSGAIGLTPNNILFVNGTLQGNPSDVVAVGSAPENHSITLGTSGSPYSCIQCQFTYSFKSATSANSVVSQFGAQFLSQQTGAPGNWPAWVTATPYVTTPAPSVVTNGGYYFYATVGGTSGGSAPTCSPGNTCSDGGVTWRSFDLAANQVYYGGLATNAQLSYPAGGTINGGIGVAFGFNSNAKLTTGAIWQQGVASGEFDTNVQTGTSTFSALGVQIVRQGTVQGAYSDVAERIGGGFSAQWLTGFQIGNAIDQYGSFLRFGGSSSEAGSTIGTIPYTIGTGIDMNDLSINGVCNLGSQTTVSFTGSIANSGVMTTTGSPSISIGQYIYNYAGGANSPQGGTKITGGSGNSWTTTPTLQTVTSTTLTAGGAYGFGQLNCPQSGGAGNRYLITRAGDWISGNGDLGVGTGVLTPVSGGVTLDTLGYKMTATTLTANSDGANWTAADLAEDPCGDQGTVTVSAGAVTGVTITQAGYAEAGSTGECPRTSGTVYWRAKTAATPNGATGENALQTPFSTPVSANYVWTQGTKLNIGTGAATLITVGRPAADVVIGGTNLPALSATVGFLHLPFTNSTSGSGGIPTGTPGNTSGPACVWNDVTFVLNCYSPSAAAWKHVSFSANAG